MTLTILDFILIIILFFFAFAGFFFGLIRSIGSLVGTILGIIIAANYFQSITDWIGLPFGLGENTIRIIIFLLIFVIINRFVGLIFLLLNKFFNLFSIIPFLKTINRIAGLIFGFIEGGVILGVLLVFVIKFPFAGVLIPAIEASQVAKYLFEIGTWLMPLLPELFEQAKSIINF